MFFNDWLYFGFLTILVEAILYLGYRLLYLEFIEYQKRKFLKENPEIQHLIDTTKGELLSPEEVQKEMESIPLISYLIYPKTLEGKGMNTENTCVVTTLGRAKEMADDSDEILQIMYFPPNSEEEKYHESNRAKLDRAKFVFKVFAEQENNDDEPSS